MKKSENLLDYKPHRNALFPWKIGKNGHVLVVVEHKGIADRLVQVLLKKTRYSDIELDDLGSFVWQKLDGETSVYEIGQMVKEKFGDKAEPLYERLGNYIKILHENKFIVYKDHSKE